MTFIEHALVIHVPLNTVYRQWTEFESFPYFMDGIKAVQRLSDIRLLWLGEVGEDEREWYTEITQQIPNQLLAWQSTSGPKQVVTVRFFYVNDDATRIIFQMDFDPFGISPDPSKVVGATSLRLMDNLRRFKRFIEASDYDSNLWHGTVKRDVDALWQTKSDPTAVDAVSQQVK